MTLQWKSLETESIEIPEIKISDEDVLKSHCNSHTPDCGAIKTNDKCQCGDYKNDYETLCPSCHSILPEDLQIDINWCPEVYTAALQYLNNE